MWKNSANSVEAQVTHYTVSINQYFMSNQTANLNSTAYYSLLLPTECSENHTVDISATNVCGMTGRSIIYRTQSQDQQCPVDTDTSSCDVTEIPTMPSLTTIIISSHSTSVAASGSGYSEQNCGNSKLLNSWISWYAFLTFFFLLQSFWSLLVVLWLPQCRIY